MAIAAFGIPTGRARFRSPGPPYRSMKTTLAQ